MSYPNQVKITRLHNQNAGVEENITDTNSIMQTITYSTGRTKTKFDQYVH